MAKRNMNYFGCLKGELLNELSSEQRLKFFKTKKLFVTTRVLNLPSNTPINLLDSNNFKVRLEPSKELLDTYYKFLIHTYQEYINNVFINFFHQFNNQIIGLKKKEAKMVGRVLYVSIINNKTSPNFDFVHMLENANGIPKLENTPKLELYYVKRDALKQRAINEHPNGLDEFLLGNSNHFDLKIKDDVAIFKEIIQFEGELKIILALNDEYQFEKNKTFQSPTIDKNNIEKPNLSVNSKAFKNKIPTEEEMDAYLMKHVFSEKKT